MFLTPWLLLFFPIEKKKKLLPLFLKDTSQSDKPNQYYQVTMYETWIYRIVQLRKSD